MTGTPPVGDVSIEGAYRSDQWRPGRDMVSGIMRIQYNGGFPVLGFYQELHQTEVPGRKMRRQYSQFPELNFFLSDFMAMRLDPDRVVTITLLGARDQVTFDCHDLAELKKFTDYLSQRVGVVRMEARGLYRLSLHGGSAEAFYHTLLPECERPRVTQSFKADLKDLRERIMREGEDVPASWGDNSFSHYRALLLPDAEKRAERELAYAALKRQWVELSDEQFANSTDLHKIFENIGRDVAACDVSPRTAQFCFNVLVSFAIGNWDAANLCVGLVQFVLPFIESFIAEFGVDDASLEPAVWAVFDAFFERFALCDFSRPMRQPWVRLCILEAGEVMGGRYPTLMSLLAQKYCTTLDFLRPELSAMFAGIWGAEVGRLWAAAIEGGGPPKAMTAMLIAILLELGPELDREKLFLYERFVENVRRFLPHVRIGGVLPLTWKILQALQRK